MTRPVIAVVNDDTMFLELMNDLLVEEGYETMLIKEGDEAYHEIVKHQPILVILDIRLEHTEAGWTVLELLRLDPQTNHIPIIVCSADKTMLSSKAEMLKAHGIDTLEKPFALSELVSLVSKYVSHPKDDASPS